jgi:autotransporter-associated beta strand protein
VISGTVTANADVTTGGAGTLTLSNVISGTGGVTMVSGGSLILSGVNNYTGITTITNGTMILKGNSALPVNSPVSLLQNGTLKILQDGAGNNGTIALNNNNGTS